MQVISVIGAGVVGLATAVQLQQAGYQVTLLDKNGPAAGCSSGNAGHFATEQVFPLASLAILRQLPAMLLNPTGPLRLRAGYLLQALPWFCRFIANITPTRQRALQQALSALNQQALPAWQRLLATTAAEDLVQFRGALLVSEQPGLQQLAASFSQYQDAGIPVNWLEQTALLAREPALSHNVQGAIEFPQVAHTSDPYALCMRLFAKFQALGGEFRQHEVHQIRKDGDSYMLELVASATAEHHNQLTQPIRTPQLVISAGAYSHLLCRQLGWKVPLEAERGYHLMTQSRPLQCPVSSLERKFIMTPMQHGLRLAGTVEFAGRDSTPDPRRAHVLLEHANQLLAQPTGVAAGTVPWSGNRPSLPDSLPVLGACPNHLGVFYNFGHQHLGLTWAACSADLLLASIQQTIPAIALKPYRINRF
jgi:D-amino-acid dehydrogenase